MLSSLLEVSKPRRRQTKEKLCWQNVKLYLCS